MCDRVFAITGRPAKATPLSRRNRAHEVLSSVNTPSTSSSPARLRIGTPQQFAWLRGIVMAVLVLNLLDAVFTLFWVYAGLAREANPLLRDLIEASPLAFVGIKLGLVGLGSALLWRHRKRPLAVVAIFLSFLIYYGLLLWHLEFLGLVLRELLAS